MKKDCTTCGSPASQRCKPCLKYGVNVYYCSKACQQSDWKVHKKICGPKSTGGAAGGGGGPSRPWGLFSSFESMVQNFISWPVDINMVAPGSNATLLHVAAEEGSEEAVRVLIAAGADVNRTSICEQGFTPLIIAAKVGSEPVVRALIDAGADVNKAKACDGTPGSGFTPLIIAAEFGFEPVARALIDAGADVNKANEFGATPMRVAAQNGHEAVIRALIAAGAVEDEGTKNLRHRNAMQQKLLQGMSGRSLPEMPTADGIHGFDPRTGQWVNLGTGTDVDLQIVDPRTGEWVNFGTGTDGLEAMMKTQKD